MGFFLIRHAGACKTYASNVELHNTFSCWSESNDADEARMIYINFFFKTNKDSWQ